MTHEDALLPVADGVWITTGPASILGMPLTSTMTVLRAGESLLLHSPIGASPRLRSAVEALGNVRHLYAPNAYHHQWVAQWAADYPDARVHAPPGLRKKRPDLRIDRIVGEHREPAFDEEILELGIDGFRLEESALLHRASGTLVVADLVHNIGAPPELWTKIYAGAMGFYDQVAISRMIRWAGFDDRAAARRSIDEILEHPFDRMIVGHGSPLETGARDALEAAYRWLPPK